MLVLSRDCDTVVRIGSDVKIKVLSIRKRRVKLGVEAPSDVRVWRDEVVSELAEHGLTPEEAVGAPTAAGPFSSLVVEDNPAHAHLISEALLECQLPDPMVVRTGAAAMRILGHDEEGGQGARPRLILLDLRLPDVSGLEVLRYIRSTAAIQTTPVVVLSVEDHNAVVMDCLEAGANAFVTKSTDYGEFRRSVARIAAFWGNDSRVPQPAGQHETAGRPVRAK